MPHFLPYCLTSYATDSGSTTPKNQEEAPGRGTAGGKGGVPGGRSPPDAN